MKIKDNNYYIEHKRDFKSIGLFKPETIEKVFNFAYAMAFGEGEHRDHRTGGKARRRKSEIFINAFQGKLAELSIYNFIHTKNKELYEKMSNPDFEVYGLGEWDNADIEINDKKISIKSTKHYGNLLLLETRDWNEDAQYIPNIKENNGHYDYTILVRIEPDGEKLLRDNRLLYQDSIEIQTLKKIILNVEWKYDIPGYLSNKDLKNVIANKQIIPQNSKLNGRINMDAENYYVEAGNLNDFSTILNKF